VLNQQHSLRWYMDTYTSSYSLILVVMSCCLVVIVQCPPHAAELESLQLYSYPLKFSSILSERWWWCTVALLNSMFLSHPSHCIIKNSEKSELLQWESLFNRPSAPEMHSCVISVWTTNCIWGWSYRLTAICALNYSPPAVSLWTQMLWKDSTINWSEDQAVPVDWEDLELLNKDCYSYPVC